MSSAASKDKTLSFSIEGRSGSLTIPDLPEYDFVVHAIFGLGEYPEFRFIAPETITTVVDIGAHVGAFSLWARLLYPRAEIYAFEPCKKQFKYLAQNSTSAVTRVFPFGVGGETEIKKIYTGEYDGCEDSVYSSGRTRGSGEDVLILAADDAISQIGIKNASILKIDTEGSEVPILSKWLKKQKPMIIYIEWHSEEDRIQIDQMLYSDYVLISSSAQEPHRGTGAYVLKKIADSIPNFHEKRISR